MKHLRTIVITLLIAVIGYFILRPDSKKEQEQIVQLRAEIALEGDHIQIRNLDDFDYLKTRLTINEHFRLNGFNMEAGEQYSLWQSEFAHSNKRRMPVSQKPVLFTIVCDLPDGRKGYYSQRFK